MKIPKPILERRRSLRITETLPFHIGHRDYQILAVTVNISQSGALCLVEKEIPLLTQLEVMLSLPIAGGLKPLRLKGVVVRKEKDPASGKFLVAVFFSELKPADRRILQNFIGPRTNP